MKKKWKLVKNRKVDYTIIKESDQKNLNSRIAIAHRKFMIL